MARKLTFIPATTSTSGGLLPLESIPADVVNDVEDAYKNLSELNGRIRVEFDTADEALIFCRQAASYATQRPEGKLRFRRSPTKNLPDNVIDFRVTRDLPSNGEDRAQEGPLDK